MISDYVTFAIDHNARNARQITYYFDRESVDYFEMDASTLKLIVRSAAVKLPDYIAKSEVEAKYWKTDDLLKQLQAKIDEYERVIRNYVDAGMYNAAANRQSVKESYQILLNEIRDGAIAAY